MYVFHVVGKLYKSSFKQNRYFLSFLHGVYLSLLLKNQACLFLLMGAKFIQLRRKRLNILRNTTSDKDRRKKEEKEKEK